MPLIPHHEVLIIGGGLAGLRAAVAAHGNKRRPQAGSDVAVLSKVYPVRSHSGAAQGGVNAALGNHPEGYDDTWQRHAFDTIKGADYLADQPRAEILAREAPERVLEMEHWGAHFSRFPDGLSLTSTVALLSPTSPMTISVSFAPTCWREAMLPRKTGSFPTSCSSTRSSVAWA